MLDIEIPPLKDGQILVRNRYTTLCRSDLHTYSGRRREKSPTILGHEIVGQIVRLGKGAPASDEAGRPLRPGDRITWAIYASDPSDRRSQLGIPQKAEGLFKYGHERVEGEDTLHGGLAEYTILRAHSPIRRLDESVPDPVAALINCSVATAAGSLRLAGELKGRKVLISGAGMLGVVASAMAVEAGARSVCVLDLQEERLQKARLFGADHGFNVQTDWEEALASAYGHPSPFDCLLEFSGAAEAMEHSLKLLDIGGTAVWVGATFPQRFVPLNPEYLIRRLLTIRGLHNYNLEDFGRAVDFIQAYHRSYPFAELVEDCGGLERVNEAFAYGVEHTAYRVGISLFG